MNYSEFFLQILDSLSHLSVKEEAYSEDFYIKIDMFLIVMIV